MLDFVYKSYRIANIVYEYFLKNSLAEHEFFLGFMSRASRFF